ncbi:hypothetical protein FACS1894182_04650 [Bacteroidia bacterium]|nr:hypothetical protein FACS1894182_04650 [Bacteroidia bacterium]
MIIGKQIFYVVAVIVVMIIASRYMKKIKDKPEGEILEEIPENIEQPLAEDLEMDETAG